MWESPRDAQFISGLLFRLTSAACPEQYEVMRGEESVAYVRLRHGELRVDYLEVGGELVFRHTFQDKEKGQFSGDQERMKYLSLIAEAISNHCF